MSIRASLVLVLLLGTAEGRAEETASYLDIGVGARGLAMGGAGGEFKAHEGVFLRLGYTSKSAAVAGSGFDAARGLTLGLGLKTGGFSLDYAAQAAGQLGSTHRFTLSSRF